MMIYLFGNVLGLFLPLLFIQLIMTTQGKLSLEATAMLESLANQEEAEFLRMFADMSPDELDEALSKIVKTMGDEMLDEETIFQIDVLKQDAYAKNTNPLTEELEMIAAEGDVIFEEPVPVAVPIKEEPPPQYKQLTADDIATALLPKKDLLLEEAVKQGAIPKETLDLLTHTPGLWEKELQKLFNNYIEEYVDNYKQEKYAENVLEVTNVI